MILWKHRIGFCTYFLRDNEAKMLSFKENRVEREVALKQNIFIIKEKRKNSEPFPNIYIT